MMQGNHPPEFCSASGNQVTACTVASRSLPHRLWHVTRDSAVWLLRLVDRGFDWYGCRHAQQRQRRNLAGYDDHMLKDIGLTRADVEAEIEKGFWRC